MSKIKLGIIGVGMAWERLHFPAMQRLKDKFEIVAVCDKDMERAQEVGKKLGLEGAAIYNDYGRMLQDEQIEAVDLMVPIPENYEAAKAVIESNKNLIAEKPFASSIEGAKELIALVEKKESKVLVAENYRYDEENKIIKQLIEDKKIGDVVYFIDHNVTEFQKDMLKDTFASTEWRQHPDYKGGVFLDSAIHHIARHRFLFGNADCICAAGKSLDADFSAYSCINALITFDNQVSCQYTFYMTGKESEKPPIGLRIFGTEGEIYLEDKNCGSIHVSHKDGTQEDISYQPGEGYYHELENFYQAVRANGSIESTPEKELGDIQVIFDILESIEKKSIIQAKNDYKRS